MPRPVAQPNPLPVPLVPVAIYTRVSTDNQTGGRFDSCESQAAICRESIRKRAGEGWHEVACYTDAAYSGSTMDRPGIRALKRQIEAGEVKVVLLYKLERVLRSTDEWVPFRSFLQRHACRLESATEDISENSPSGRLKNNLLMSVAEYERLNTAEKTRAKMLQQAKQGIWNGGWLPYGYAYDAKTQTLFPDPIEAPIIRRVFEQAAQLVPLQTIANALTEKGIRTRERSLRRRDGTVMTVGGRIFRSDGLRMLIGNPIYRGSLRFGGKEYAARHEPIVSAEIWEKANAAASQIAVSPKGCMLERDSQMHLLKGIVHCGSCGRALVPHDSGKKNAAGRPYRYYYCGFVLKERNPEGCSVGRLPADGLERVTLEFLSQLSRHPDLVAKVIETAREHRKVDRPMLLTEMQGLQRELERVKKHERNLLDIAMHGGEDLITESYKQRVIDLRNDRQRITVELERRRHAIIACEAAIGDEKRIVSALEKLRSLLPQLPLPAQKDLCRLFLERMEVRKVASGPDQRRRLLEFRMKVHLPRLVEGMDEKVVDSAKLKRSPFPLSVRGVNFEARVDFTNAPRGTVTIVAPFTQVVRVGARSPRPAATLPKAVEKLHPIHEVLAWQRQLDSGAVESRAALAKENGITRAAVTQHLRLCRLAPEIVDWLKELKTAADVRQFSMTRMSQIAELPLQQQRSVFSKMSKGLGFRV